MSRTGHRISSYAQRHMGHNKRRRHRDNDILLEHLQHIRTLYSTDRGWVVALFSNHSPRSDEAIENKSHQSSYSSS